MSRNQKDAMQQKVMQMAQRNAEILAQKRETIAVNSLLHIIHNPNTDIKDVEGNTTLAVQYADAMLTKMYVAPEAEPEQERKENNPNVS